MSGPLRGLQQDASGVLVCGFDGTSPPEELLRWTGAKQLAGVILFKRNIESAAQTAALLADVHAKTPSGTAPILACVDQEGGRVARLGAPVLTLPPARVIARMGDTAVTRQAGRVLGEQLRALGFNMNFAPVLDVDTNPDNPIIGDRSFGTTPSEVSTQAIAFAEGLHAGGVLSCGKHFPGHGDTDLDSHLALPRITHALDRMRSVELAPFIAAKEALPALMSAHIVVDSIDASVPATLSPKAMTDVLRNEIGYAGTLFSDDLEMKAVSQRWSIPDAAVLAVAAGCDALLVCSQFSACRDATEALVREAEKSPAFAARLAEARRRVDTLRDKISTLPVARPFETTVRNEPVEALQALLNRAATEGHA